MKFILGKKIEMTQVFSDDRVVPVTKVLAGPCWVSQVRTEEKDGYSAVQLGFQKNDKSIQKEKKNGKKFRYIKEFRLDVKQGQTKKKHIGRKDPKSQENTDENRQTYQVGDEIKADVFTKGDQIHVSALSKGKGFQGVVRRHGFHGQKASHGIKDQERMPGSIGSTDAARVFKGTRMGGQMGDKRITVKKLEIVEVFPKENIILIKGAIPGARNGLVEIITG